MRWQAAVTLVLCSALPAAAFDLTGTWQGAQLCRTFNGATVRVRKDPSTLEITQSGASLNLEVDGTTLYHGTSVLDATNPGNGRVVFARCSTTAALTPPAEMGRVRVVTRPSGYGRVHGFAVVDSATGGVGTCTWLYFRTAPGDPVIGACP